MNKRDFLKLLPLAAVTATTLRVDDVEARAHELKPEKKYLIVLKADIEPENGAAFARSIRERLGPNVAVVGGADLEVYELL